MRYMFIVQGEGNGHMTQSLAIKEMIEELGHEVCCVLVGNIKEGRAPDYFKLAFKCEVIEMRTPSFIYDNGVNILKTLKMNASSIVEYLNSLIIIKKKINEINPDVVINFYEPLFGLYRLMGGKCKESFAIAHQFMFLHPDYIANKINEKQIQMLGGKLFTMLVGYKSKKIALSITKEETKNSIVVVPPILRKDVFKKDISNDGFVLIYSLASDKELLDILFGCSKDIKFEVFIRKFWSSNDDSITYENVTFNKLDGKKFLEYMKRCEMVVCTAGFETPSESSYLGKKLLVIPTHKHFEQYFNGKDFQQSGLAKMKLTFKNISKSEMDINPVSIELFRNWVDTYKYEFRKSLNI